MGSKELLLVEDEVLIALKEKSDLEKYEYEVITVNSGEKAIAEVERRPEIDLVLMDINLGKGMDGPSAAEQILRRRNIPIIFLSSHIEPEVVRMTEKITSYGYVVKDSGINVLDASIKMAFKLYVANLEILSSKATHESMIANISDVIRIVGEDRLVKYCSPNIEKWFGWKPEDLLGTDGFLTVHPDDAERAQNGFLKLLGKANSTLTMEFRFKCKDGSYKPVELTATNLSADPTINGILINYHDISARKQADDKLRVSEERYASSLSAVNDGLWDWNVPTGNAYFSPEYYSILGYENEGFPATYNSWKSLVHQDDIERAEVVLQQAIGLGSAFTFDIRMQGKGGDWIWVSARGKTIELDPQGKAVRMIGTLSSIAERKLIEKALTNSELRYRRLFEAAQDGVLILDVESGQIVDVNPYLEKMLGYSKKEMVEKAIWEIGAFKDIVSNKSNFMELQQKEYIRYEDLPLQTADGKMIEVEFVSNIYTVDKERVIQCNIRDVSDRKMAEGKIRKLLSERELLLKEVHHRIKNNMNTLNSILCLQLDRLKESAGKKAIADASGRIRSMMILYDKLYRSLDFESLSISAYLPPLVDDIMAQFETKTSMRIIHRYDDMSLKATTLQTIGIFVNEALTNIMKYAFIGRDTGLVEISATITGQHISISVYDDGVGIPDSIDFKASSGFGFKLMEALAQQLDGECRIERGGGAAIVLEFEK